MYTEFYGFTKQPFQTTPDIEFLYRSPSHEEALACIEYGVGQRKGLIAISGEVGVGKTIILQFFLAKTDANKIRAIYLRNPKVSFVSLLDAVLRELGAEPVAGNEATEKFSQLHQVLIAAQRNDDIVVLIIDDAQNMPIETLESICLLLNLETSTQKLIQLILVGQPELDALLDRHELRQIRDRIVLRARIEPLTYTESMAYIQHRLSNVTKHPGTVFSKQALELIVKTASGIPRKLNILCDNALITGFGYQESVISVKTAKEVIADLNGRRPPAMWRIQPRHAAVLLSVALPILFYVYLGHFSALPEAPTLAPPSNKVGGQGSSVLVSDSEPKTVKDLSLSEKMELSETGRLLAVLLDCGRVVVGKAQATINNPRLEDKAFSSTVFEGLLRKEFQTRTRHDLHNLAAATMPEFAKPLLVRLAFFMQKAVHDVQPDINKKGIGFKGFIPATFATQVSERFSKATGLKLRQIGPPRTPPRNPYNKPDEQEEQLLNAIQKNHPRVGDHIIEQQAPEGIRVLLPLFYTKQCLACHGSPKGEMDISGYEKEGFKDGDLGGAISILVPAQSEVAKANE